MRDATAPKVVTYICRKCVFLRFKFKEIHPKKIFFLFYLPLLHFLVISNQFKSFFLSFFLSFSFYPFVMYFISCFLCIFLSCFILLLFLSFFPLLLHLLFPLKHAFFQPLLACLTHPSYFVGVRNLDLICIQYYSRGWYFRWALKSLPFVSKTN